MLLAAAAISQNPPWLRTVPVGRLLASLSIGMRRRGLLLRQAAVPARRPVGDLTGRERMLLAHLLSPSSWPPPRPALGPRSRNTVCCESCGARLLNPSRRCGLCEIDPVTDAL